MRDLSSAMRTTPDFSMEQWQEEYDRKVKLLNKQLEIVAVEAFDPEAVFKLNLELGYQDF
jgi:hypothetical protein